MDSFAFTYEASNNAWVREDLEQFTCKIIANLDFWYAVGCIIGMLGFWEITYTALHVDDIVVVILLAVSPSKTWRLHSRATATNSGRCWIVY
jgi:hypothetical protein